MDRRTCLSLLAAAFSGRAPAAQRSIQLHVDLDVEPAREREMLRNYRRIFRPAIRKQPGFLGVRLLRLRRVVTGEASKDSNYRLVIRFQTEEQRQAWVASEDHQRAWPAIERTLRPGRLRALLWEAV
ncbi:MAG: antibiotic biosynthesis monooxygenase [Bryobacteraceae bacterium]